MFIKSVSQEKGFSLVELMIALALGLMVIGSVFFILASTLATHVSTLKMTRLNQELQTTMGMLVRDLRRAGHWALAPEIVRASSNAELTLSAPSGSSVTATSNNPDTFANLEEAIIGRTLMYVGVGGDIGLAIIQAVSDSTVMLDIANTNPFPSTILPENTWTILNPFAEIILVEDLDENGEPDDSCLLFSYDSNNDGLLDNNDRYGFRLDTEQSVIKLRQAGTDCRKGGWEKLTDDTSVEITELRIEDLSTLLTSVGGYEMGLRKFRITLKGNLKEDKLVERTIRSTVKIRNNEML